MKNVSVKVDGRSLLANHFAKMSEEGAVKAMADDGIKEAKDPGWAKKAYAACVNAVKEADKKAADKKPGK